MAFLGHTWDDYTVELYDINRAYLGDLTHVYRMQHSKSIFGEGSFSFAVHVKDRFASLLSTQAIIFVVIRRSGVTVFEGFTQKPAHRYAEAERGVSEYIEVSGVCLAKILDWRHAWATGGSMPVTDHVDDIMKYVVENSIGPSAAAAPDTSVRALTGFAVAADKHERAGVETLDPKNANLGEWIRRTGTAYSVDFDVYFDASMDFVFETWWPRRGEDRSETNSDGNTPVIINDAGHNILGANAYWDSYQLRNAVILEDGSGGQIDAASIAKFLRREILAKSTDATRLDTFLSENELDSGCVFEEFQESIDCQWGVHFNLGDLLTWNNLHLGMTTAKHQLLATIDASIDDDNFEHLKFTFRESGEQHEPNETDRMEGGGSADDWEWDLPWADASGIMPVQAANGAGTDLYIPRADHEHKFLIATAGGNVTPTAGAAGGEITFVAGSGIAFTVAASQLTIGVTGGTVHAAVTLDATINANLLSLTGQELGLDTQTANYVFAGPTSGAVAAPSFRGLIDSDLGGSRANGYILVSNGAGTCTWTAPATATHAAVTLNATIDTSLLALSGQELTLDTQLANKVFCGPETGAAAAPTFRSLVYADVSTIVPSNTHHHHVSLSSDDTDGPQGILLSYDVTNTDGVADVTLSYTSTPSNAGSSHNHSISINCKPTTDENVTHKHNVTVGGTTYETDGAKNNHTHTYEYVTSATTGNESTHTHGYDKTTGIAHHHHYDKATGITHHHHYSKAATDTSGPQ